MVGIVPKFGGTCPGENGIARIWNEPKYKVGFSPGAIGKPSFG